MKKMKVRSGHFIMPSKPHSDTVKKTKKEIRNEAKRERNERD